MASESFIHALLLFLGLFLIGCPYHQIEIGQSDLFGYYHTDQTLKPLELRIHNPVYNWIC